MDKLTSRTAAQRVWIIDEVVRNILAQLPSAGCSKTLARCACVSTAVSEPALDLLWRKMSGLLPFCTLLRGVLEVLDDTTNNDASATTPVPIDDDHWQRFMRYARRVRKLHYHCTEGSLEHLQQRTFASLVHRAAHLGAPLLPQLEELSWLQFSHDITHYLPFISPTLRRVTVYVQVGPAARVPYAPDAQGSRGCLLQLLDVHSPDIEEISLAGIDFPASLEPLLAFKRLRSLRLGSVTAPTAVIVAYCAAMPTLSALFLDLSAAPAASRGSPPGEEDGPGLYALKTLHIAGAPRAIEDVLGAVRSSALQSVTLALSVPEADHDGAARCMGLLGARLAPSLQTLRVRLKHAADPGHGTPRPFWSFVEPLLALRALRECALVVEDALPPALADADLRAMAVAWPALVSLEVGVRPCASPAAALPSIAALEAFARHCSDILTLRIPIHEDLSVLDGWCPQTVGEAPHTGLRDLWLFGVWFGKEGSRRAVRYLQHTFPGVNLRPMLNAGILQNPGVYQV
ncbi:hypothetical protein BD413DRAFT_621953 [Trametes elegans]|nr:hypothetical protein BD413DRAFT_621953 [Trametes elegans]